MSWYTKFIDRMFPKEVHHKRDNQWLSQVLTGSFFKISNLRGNTSLSEIRTKIKAMRALVEDSQVSTALSYYATDATTTNTSGLIIWASSDDPKLADVINQLFKRWEVNEYARDHILELATIGNFYMPTTSFYRDLGTQTQTGIALNNNTIVDVDYDIIPSTMLDPEDVLHIYHQGKSEGFIYQPGEKARECLIYPDEAIIHFSLGGTLGKYKIDTLGDDEKKEYDVKFADPLLEKAVQPTQTLSLLEDANLLASFARVVKFVCARCGSDEDEQRSALQDLKDTIEQQISLNASTGDMQSFVNPQSPNNLIFLPYVENDVPISIVDLDMVDHSEADNQLLDHFLNKKLSVLGIPKEAMNFSSNEGLGGAGNVMSQRSSLYANGLDRLMTAYKNGWEQAINRYFEERGFSGYKNKFTLHMNPLVTLQSTINFDKRESAISQGTNLVALLNSLKVENPDIYKTAMAEILAEVLPKTGSGVANWDVNTDVASEEVM